MATPQHLVPPGELIRYRPEQQYAGMFVSGFDWRLYCTGTFRQSPANDDVALICLDRYVCQLGDSLHFPNQDRAYYAALENITPGVGGRPIR
jgi:hypothetical protein